VALRVRIAAAIRGSLKHSTVDGSYLKVTGLVTFALKFIGADAMPSAANFTAGGPVARLDYSSDARRLAIHGGPSPSQAAITNTGSPVAHLPRWWNLAVVCRILPTCDYPGFPTQAKPRSPRRCRQFVMNDSESNGRKRHVGASVRFRVRKAGLFGFK
jgi:hypothetical protein